MMNKPPNISLHTLIILQRVQWRRYGFELVRETGIKPGTLYPILHRLKARKWICEIQRDLMKSLGPPRVIYGITDNGSRILQAALSAISGGAR